MTDAHAADAPVHAWSAERMADAFARGQTCPEAVVEAVLAQIARVEPRVHAFWHLDAEGARRDAAESAARWRAGTPRSRWDGVPGTLKENVATAGLATPVGTAGGSMEPAAEDAPPAARWREAGLVLLGKTTMPDLGMLSSGLSSLHVEPARNPWNLACTPGGSSAGAGSAGAAGFGPLHLGTDIGGSIRLPAGWCGLVGLKPSAGRLPIHPPYVGRVAGPMTRTVRDAAAMMAMLARPDPQRRDATAMPDVAVDWMALEPRPGTPSSKPLEGLRLGLWMDAGWGLPVEPGTRGVIERAARRLADAGATVVEIPPFCTRAMADGMDRFWRMRAWLDLQSMPPERRDRVLPYIRAWAAPAAGYDGGQVFTGYSQMQALRDAALAATAPFDALISPTSPVPAYPAHLASPVDDPQQPFEHIAFTLPFNMSEQPALTLHAGFTEDPTFGPLPVGLQIACHRHDDLGALRIGAVWELLREPMPRWPLDRW